MRLGILDCDLLTPTWWGEPSAPFTPRCLSRAFRTGPRAGVSGPRARSATASSRPACASSACPPRIIEAYLASGEWRGRRRRLCHPGHRRLLRDQAGRFLYRGGRPAALRDGQPARGEGYPVRMGLAGTSAELPGGPPGRARDLQINFFMPARSFYQRPIAQYGPETDFRRPVEAGCDRRPRSPPDPDVPARRSAAARRDRRCRAGPAATVDQRGCGAVQRQRAICRNRELKAGSVQGSESLRPNTFSRPTTASMASVRATQPRKRRPASQSARTSPGSSMSRTSARGGAAPSGSSATISR